MGGVTLAKADRGGANSAFPWSRFPSNWAVGSAFSERVSARLIWLLVPLQYYVFTHVSAGVASGDLLSVVGITMFSFIALFMVSLALATLITSRDPGERRALTRMWMIALMLGTTCAYAAFAASLFAGLYLGLTADIVGDFLFRQSRDGVRIPGLNWQTFVSYLIYAGLACFLMLMTRRAFWHVKAFETRSKIQPPTESEPLMIVVIVFVAVVMFGTILLAIE